MIKKLYKRVEKFRHNHKGALNIAMVGGLAALLIMIIITAMVFYQVAKSVPAGQTQVETFAVQNYTTDETYTLQYEPYGTPTVEIYYSNTSTWQTVPSSLVSVSGTTVTVSASAYSANVTQTKITYDTDASVTVSDVKNTARTVFTLFTVLAIVIVAVAIMKLVMGYFGRY